MGILTQDDAKKIADKLGADIERSGGAHDVAYVFYDGKLIAQFGIRRASKDVGHGHIPSSIFVQQNQAKKLAKCTMSQDEWIQLMKEKGKIAINT